MAEPERGGARRPQAVRRTTENQPVRPTEEASAPAPRPRPVATKPRQATGVPMAGQSYAKRQAEEVRQAKGTATTSPPVPASQPAPRPPPQKAADQPDLDLEEDFDLEEEYEEDVASQEAKPVSAETSSKLYSTRRALAEQVNQDVGVRPGEQSDNTGMAALREKREAWKKMVAKKEEQGQSPYIVRWAKVSFFPLVYFGMSMIIVRNLRYEWAEFYDYDPFFILMGFAVGFIFLVMAATSTMMRAKRIKKPILLKGRATWIGVLVFVGISFYLAFDQGLAYAWLFSIGFLGAGLLIVAIGLLLEKSGKGVFWIKDPMEGSDKRWLEFVPTVEG